MGLGVLARFGQDGRTPLAGALAATFGAAAELHSRLVHLLASPTWLGNIHIYIYVYVYTGLEGQLTHGVVSYPGPNQ